MSRNGPPTAGTVVHPDVTHRVEVAARERFIIDGVEFPRRDVLDVRSVIAYPASEVVLRVTLRTCEESRGRASEERVYVYRVTRVIRAGVHDWRVTHADGDTVGYFDLSEACEAIDKRLAARGEP